MKYWPILIMVLLMVTLGFLIRDYMEQNGILNSQTAILDSLFGANQVMINRVENAQDLNNLLQDSLKFVVHKYNLQSQSLFKLNMVIDSLKANLVPVSIIDTVYIDSTLYQRYALDTLNYDAFAVTGNVLSRTPPHDVNFLIWQSKKIEIDILLAKTKNNFNVALIKSSSKLVHIDGVYVEIEKKQKPWDRVWGSLGFGDMASIDIGYQKLGVQYLRGFGKNHFLVKWRIK